MPQRSGWELEQAIKRRDTAFIEVEFRRNNLNLRANFRGRSPLTASVVANEPEALQLLLRLGASPNGKSYEGGRRETPLHTAVRLKNLACVRILTSSGADPALTNFYGQDVIYQAVVENAYEILEYFLSSLPYKPSHKHESRVACPVHLALHGSHSQPSKRKSLFLLLRFHYKCSCLLYTLHPSITTSSISSITDAKATLLERSPMGTTEPNHNHSNIRSQEDMVIKVDPEVFHWISITSELPLVPVPQYFRAGQRHLPPHESGQDPGARDFIRLEIVEGRKDSPLLEQPSMRKTRWGPNGTITLCNLVRGTLRAWCAQVASEQKITFRQAVTSLPLPLKLINFLLLSDLTPRDD